MTTTVYETNLKDFPLVARGKVRDIYDLGEHLLMISTDRISAFDVILPDPIPEKGAVLTQISQFWMEKFSHLVTNHLTDVNLEDVLPPSDYEVLKERAVVVKKAKPFPVECVARGYLIGSGWKDYQKTGSVCGIELPKGLELAQKLPEPIFTPATKADVGDHDENISFDHVANLVGNDMAERLKTLTLTIFDEAQRFAEERGILIADTKFEFGIYNDDVILIDEALTPDSSRFWAKESYQVGISPASFDKQIVRDYLETLDWNKKAPGPKLPSEIMEKASRKYQEIRDILTKG